MDVKQLFKIGTFLSILSSITPTFAAHHPLLFNMEYGVTPISHHIYWLHMTIFWICCVIGVAVFGVMIYSLIHHRKSKGYVPAKFHGSLRLEIFWSVIPFLILVGMAVPATIVLIEMDDDRNSEVNIKVTGYQWKWQYEYLDLGISFFSNLSTPQAQLSGTQKPNYWYLLEVDHPLVVPVHKKIRFLVTSNDVVHSWWVPSLGIKRDAIPGFIYEAWARIDKPGIYRGQCAELCGMNHGFMPIVVKAVSENEFNQWIAKQTGNKATATSSTPTQPMTQEELMSMGQTVYEKNCSVCHKPDGSGMPPTFPALVGAPITTGPIAAHIDIVLNGKSGTAMQAFKSQLSDQEIAAVITYERNSWGNNNQSKYGKNAGGVVQPADVTKARSK